MGKGVRGAALCQGHLSAAHPVPQPLPGAPCPGVDPIAPHPREGKGLPIGDARWRKGLLPCLLPVPAVLCPPPRFFCTGTTCPGMEEWGRWLSLPARGPFSQFQCRGGTSASCPSSCPPCHPAPAHPLWLAPKWWVPPDKGLPGLSGGPLSPGSGGGPSPGHPREVTSQQPHPRAGPRWLGNAVYISLYFFLLCNLSMV